jgi:uncharacterized protein involved in cysteine biosynthesis
MVGFLVVWVARVRGTKALCPFPADVKKMVFSLGLLAAEGFVLFLGLPLIVRVLLGLGSFSILVLNRKKDVVGLFSFAFWFTERLFRDRVWGRTN